MGLAIDFQDVKKWGGNAKDDLETWIAKFFVSNMVKRFMIFYSK